MKANEFRLGNLIYSPIEKEIVKLVAIEQGNRPITLGKMGTSSFSGFDCLEPIPLTEEWLLKLGLQIREITVDGKQQKHYSDFRNIAIEVLSKDYLMLGLHKGHEHIEPIRRVEYLHQLQNLYWCLCGEELTFNNL